MNCSPGAGRRPRLSAGTPLAKVAQTALDNLGKALGESCSAATDGDNVLYIARAAVNNLLSVDLGRGSRLPAWATSMGRVLLSALPEEQLEVTLSRATLNPLHPAYPVRFGRAYARRSPGCACRAMPSPTGRSRWACARWRYPCCRVMAGGGRAECRGARRDGQRRGVKREGPLRRAAMDLSLQL
jgi:IclR family pca regulon transcriptional regulator